jgi:hypothetical protein
LLVVVKGKEGKEKGKRKRREKREREGISIRQVQYSLKIKGKTK